jgi:Holliday junction resolvasome RuvABC endonuclease subunit
MANLLAVDTGYRNVGVAVIDINTGKIIKTKTITTGKIEYYKALDKIVKLIEEIIISNNIEIIIFEQVYGRRKISMIAGAIVSAAINNNINKIVGYTPGHMKKQISGNGRCSKEKLQEVLKVDYNIDLIDKSAHEADAIGHGLTYLQNVKPEVIKSILSVNKH